MEETDIIKSGCVATADDLNFGRLESQVRDNANLTERKADGLSNGICNLGYTMSEKFAQTNQLIINESNKTRDMIQQDKIERLQARVSQLELEKAIREHKHPWCDDNM